MEGHIRHCLKCSTRKAVYPLFKPTLARHSICLKSLKQCLSKSKVASLDTMQLSLEVNWLYLIASHHLILTYKILGKTFIHSMVRILYPT